MLINKSHIMFSATTSNDDVITVTILPFTSFSTSDWFKHETVFTVFNLCLDLTVLYNNSLFNVSYITFMKHLLPVYVFAT